MWGGRFKNSTNSKTSQLLMTLNNSLNVDKRLYQEDIQGSIAYAKALQEINLLTREECEKIIEGLKLIENEWRNDLFLIKEEIDEDIHTANERRLTELIGESVAYKLHVGRSRNDQVLTDVKLWLKNHVQCVQMQLRDGLIKALIRVCEDNVDVLMPGYTHLQRAQPVRFSHWLLSHTFAFKSDSARLNYLFENSLDVLPLGSGALAGNPFNIDRRMLAQELGFNQITLNSMHAVGDRDFILEFLFDVSMLGMHLSRLAEDLIIYCTKEFGFITLDESYSTGSSLMPQKRNPDSLELIRGIGGSLYGNVTSMMLTMKGLPSTYNKDLQCDKEFLFDSFDKISKLLDLTRGVVCSLKVNKQACESALSCEMLSTDLAYYLVKHKGIPFREAHHIAGKVVAYAENKNVLLSDLTLEELNSISNSNFDADVSKVWNYENSVEQYTTEGGTSKERVIEQINHLKQWLLL